MHILWLAALVAIPACTNREAHTTDRTVTPLPPQVVTPVNPPLAEQPMVLNNNAGDPEHLTAHFDNRPS